MDKTAPCVEIVSSEDFSRALGDNTNTGAAAAGEGNEIVGRSSDAAAGWKRLEGGRDGEIAALPPSCLLLFLMSVLIGGK